MDPIMQSLFGEMPISNLPSIEMALNQKKSQQTILIMGAIIVVGGIIAYNIYKKNQELKFKLKAVSIKPRE